MSKNQIYLIFHFDAMLKLGQYNSFFKTNLLAIIHATFSTKPLKYRKNEGIIPIRFDSCSPLPFSRGQASRGQASQGHGFTVLSGFPLSQERRIDMKIQTGLV